MIRVFYGIDSNPFSTNGPITLLEHQQQVFDVLQVHCHKGGFCLLMGKPGCGKTIIKRAIGQHSYKPRWLSRLPERCTLISIR